MNPCPCCIISTPRLQQLCWGIALKPGRCLQSTADHVLHKVWPRRQPAAGCPALLMSIVSKPKASRLDWGILFGGLRARSAPCHRVVANQCLHSLSNHLVDFTTVDPWVAGAPQYSLYVGARLDWRIGGMISGMATCCSGVAMACSVSCRGTCQSLARASLSGMWSHHTTT